MDGTSALGHCPSAMKLASSISVLAFCIAGCNSATPLPDTSPAPTDARLAARGAQLAAVGNCHGCHTRQGGDPYAGGFPMSSPWGTIYSTNITPDKDTGIGTWSLVAFTRAMHEGVRQGRRQPLSRVSLRSLHAHVGRRHRGALRLLHVDPRGALRAAEEHARASVQCEGVDRGVEVALSRTPGTRHGREGEGASHGRVSRRRSRPLRLLPLAAHVPARQRTSITSTMAAKRRAGTLTRSTRRTRRPSRGTSLAHALPALWLAGASRHRARHDGTRHPRALDCIAGGYQRDGDLHAVAHETAESARVAAVTTS